MTLIEKGPRPLFDTGRTPADKNLAGAQPAGDVWGVGPKTVARLREKLALDPKAQPTIADFAYTSLDQFDATASQKGLLGDQQAELVNGLKLRPEDAKTPEAQALLAAMKEHVDTALGALAAGTPSKGFVYQGIVSHARSSAMAFGIYGPVSMPSPDDLAKATAQGMTVPEGSVALLVKRATPGEVDPGVAVVVVHPRDLLEPVLVHSKDGAPQHSFILARKVKPARAFVIEEPTDEFALLKSWQGRTMDAAAQIWIDKDPQGRRDRLALLRSRVDSFAAAVDTINLGAHSQGQMTGALSAFRSILEISEKLIDS